MISRIRLEAIGSSADEVERTLYPHADEIEKLLGVGVSRGECVIERDTGEPFESLVAFKGRLLLYPNISRDDRAFQPVRPAAHAALAPQLLNG